MRHLMNPLDFSVDELDRLFDLANDIEANRTNIKTPATVKSLPPAFMNQAPGQG